MSCSVIIRVKHKTHVQTQWGPHFLSVKSEGHCATYTYWFLFRQRLPSLSLCCPDIMKRVKHGTSPHSRVCIVVQDLIYSVLNKIVFVTWITTDMKRWQRETDLESFSQITLSAQTALTLLCLEHHISFFGPIFCSIIIPIIYLRKITDQLHNQVYRWWGQDFCMPESALSAHFWS